jgi:iron(III) transport system permease protein
VAHVSAPAIGGGSRGAQRRLARGAALDGQQIASWGVLAVLLVVVGGPLLTVAWMSLRRGLPGQASPLLLDNYVSAYGNPAFWGVLANTAVFALLTLAVTFVFLVPMTFLLTRCDLPLRWVFVGLLSVSIVVPTFLRAIGWIMLLSPQIGLINQALMGLFGLTEAPLSIYTMGGMAFIQGLSFVPAGFFMLSAAYRAMDPTLEEAAYTSGLGRLRTFVSIDLPLTAPAVLGVFVYLLMTALSVFEAPAIIGLPGRIFVLSSLIYLRVQPNFGLPDYGGAGAYGMAMLLLGLGLSLVYLRVIGQSRRYSVVSGKGYRPRTLKLGRWKPLALAFVLLFFVLEIGLPLGMLVWTSLTPYMMVPSLEALGLVSLANYTQIFDHTGPQMITNTLVLVAVAPLVALVLSILAAWIVTRSRSRVRGSVDVLAFLPQAVPHILFAVALAYLALLMRSAIPLYGSVAIIVLAHGTAFLAFGSRALNSAMIQIHRDLEEAGRVAGLTAIGTLRLVVVPLVASAVFSSWFWIALLSYREVTMALILNTRSNEVLATAIWAMWRDNKVGPVAALGTLLVLVLLALLLIGGLVFRRVLLARAASVDLPAAHQA